MLGSLEELRVWQRAHALTLVVYKSTLAFPVEEKFGLVSQLRRASISIGNNIAEGNGRRTTKDYVAFLYMAYGSCQELRSMFRIGVDLGYLDKIRYAQMSDDALAISKMLKKLIASLSENDPIR